MVIFQMVISFSRQIPHGSSSAFRPVFSSVNPQPSALESTPGIDIIAVVTGHGPSAPSLHRPHPLLLPAFTFTALVRRRPPPMASRRILGAADPVPNGKILFVYRHIGTNQILYSLRQSMKVRGITSRLFSFSSVSSFC